jgi:hypothetical protein
MNGLNPENSTGPSDCSVSGCITGYWTNGYETQYRGAIETTEFLFCPICGKKILKPNAEANHEEER